MPTWAKFVLVAVIIGLALMAVGVVMTGRWIRASFDSFEKETIAAGEEGRKFGVGREAEACVVESLARLQKCTSLVCEPRMAIFMSSCLQTATTPPGYCEEIRKRTLQEECERRGWKGSSQQRCTTVMTMLQTHCEQPR